MQLERVRPMVIRMTLHTYEATALITAARWVAEGGKDDLPDEAVEHLREVLASYDEALSRIGEHHPGDSSHN
jgi:hypothetical protein